MAYKENIIENKLWEDLYHNTWAKKPCLFKAACVKDLFPEPWILESLLLVKKQLENGNSAQLSIYDKDNICVTASTHSNRVDTGIIPLLPSSKTESLNHYFKLLSINDKFSNFTLFLNQPHSYHPEIWMMMKQILGEMFRIFPLPEGHITSDIFIGNYKKTPFGIHKDTLHNFMFMTHGKRLMHFWPDNKKKSGYDHSKKSSFKVEPGDILYWPPQYWHIGENLDSIAVSVNMNIWEGRSHNWAKDTIFNSITKTAKAITPITYKMHENDYKNACLQSLNTLSNSAPDVLNEISEHMVDSISGPILQRYLNQAWAVRISAFALNKPLPRKSISSFNVNATYIADQRSPLFIIEHLGKLLMACNGHITVKDDTLDWRNLVSRLNSGEAFQPMDILKTTLDLDREELYDWLKNLFECKGIERYETEI